MSRPDPYGGARVGHGIGCVALTLERPGAVLTPDQARALARRLERQAGHAEQWAQEHPEVEPM